MSIAYLKYKKYFLIFLFLFALNLFIFRDLLAKINSNLIDWRDYPFVIWVIEENLWHLKNFAFTSWSNLNIFYPLPLTLFFSDTFFTQTLMALPLSFLITNKILLFNILFFMSLALNCLTVEFFWSRFTKNQLYLLSISIFTLFSTMFFANLHHFQVFSFWPFFLTLGILFSSTTNLKKALWLALATAVQAYSSLYLAIFLLLLISLHALIFKQIKNYLYFLSIFLILFSPLLYGYVSTRLVYDAKREYGEYVQYSLNLTDYFFYANLGSIFNKLPVIQKWQSFNFRYDGIFPGISVSILSLLGLLKFKKIKSRFYLALAFKKTDLFFFLVLIFSFIASLGPRLNIAGIYTSIPLPYHFLLKFFPPLEFVRVITRWYIPFSVSLFYFSLQGLKKIKHPTLICLLVIINLLEFVPINLKSDYYDYLPSVYQKINCRPEQVLIEYPLTQFDNDASILDNLVYRTSLMLASTHHHCNLVNGYSGYIPQAYEAYESELFAAQEASNSAQFFKLLNSKNVSYFKLNKQEIFTDRTNLLSSWMKQEKDYQLIFEDDDYLLAKKND